MKTTGSTNPIKCSSSEREGGGGGGGAGSFLCYLGLGVRKRQTSFIVLLARVLYSYRALHPETQWGR